MSISILEALENAEYNLCQGKTEINKVIGIDQLHNAVTLLLKGYGLDDDIEAVFAEYESLDGAPNKEE